MRIFFILCLALCVCATPADAKKKKKKPVGPPSPIAREIFGKQTAPAPVAARSIGGYARGCIAGAKALPIDGPAWQAMRLSRNRNWGHPKLIALVEKLAVDAKKHDGWSGLLVGDLSQPRGGPMLTGHASHQVGLDADIWLTPMPDRVLSAQEREEMMATNVVADDWMDVNPNIWSPTYIALLKTAAQDAEVERVLVNPAIKKALCREARGDRHWLSKVRPFYRHNYHMHIRIHCPQDSTGCKGQDPPPAGDGCGKELAWWFTPAARKPPKTPAKLKPPLRLADLPPACRTVLAAP
jgi:penicillin-insensitive murein endopeptidase